MEAVGAPETQCTCVRLARPQGQVMFFGVPREAEYVFPFTEFYRKQLNLTSSTGTEARRDFPMAFDLIVNGQVKVDPIITHRLPFLDLPRAMELAVDGRKDGAIKIMLELPS